MSHAQNQVKNEEKDKSAIQPAVDFILELDKLKGVTRKNKPLGLERYENSAEHSWQLCLLAIALARYADAPVDLNRVICMLLVHDIGEIDTGDTMVFIEEGLAARKAAELVAVTRIFDMLPGDMLPGGLLPGGTLPDHTSSDKSDSNNSAANNLGSNNLSGDNPGPELLALWKEFESGATPESRFANAVDRSMPVLLNLASEGQSWKENGISYERVVKRIEPEIKAGCPALWEYLRVNLEEARGKGYFGA